MVDPSPRRSPRERALHTVAGTGICVLIVALTFVRFVEGYVRVDSVDGWAIAAVCLVSTTAALRGRSPELFVLASLVTNLVYTLEHPFGYPGLGLLAALPFAAYSVASQRPRRRAVPWVFATGVALIGTAMIVRGVSLLNIFPLSVASMLLCGYAFGLVARTRRELLDSLRLRAAEAEATREALAEARVAEERVQHARRLHDTVGHRLAVINLQAQSAALSFEGGDARPVESLRAISESAREVLDDMGILLRTLLGESGPARERTITDIPRITAQLEADGLRIDRHLDELDIPPALSVLVYEVIEETLINASRYADRARPVRLVARGEEDEVVVLVENAVGPLPPEGDSTGLGLALLRDRVRRAGGRLTVTASAGSFSVVARMPRTS